SVQMADGDAATPQVARVAVTVRGPRSSIANLRAADVKILLDQTPDGQLKPRLQLPPDRAARVEIVSTNPAQFSLKK
ncbi:MAG TPA: hypothetical protein VE775_01055, partial [Pyrinomonadaceae bacterium]|nr:hypothetical protein [Pyrinomonadaceae bacterium]